jgi:hypothetical protein
MPILADDPDAHCARLGYVLGYLRHGSLGRPAPGGPTDRGAWPPVRWRGLALRSRRAVRLPGGLDTDAMVTRSTLACRSSARCPAVVGAVRCCRRRS